MQQVNQELIQKLQANNITVMTLEQYEETIAQWGFKIHKPFLKQMACTNGQSVGGTDLYFTYQTSQAVLAEKLQGEYVGFANVNGYSLMPSEDPRRNAFNEFRKNEVFFTYKDKIWTI